MLKRLGLPPAPRGLPSRVAGFLTAGSGLPRTGVLRDKKQELPALSKAEPGMGTHCFAPSTG